MIHHLFQFQILLILLNSKQNIRFNSKYYLKSMYDYVDLNEEFWHLMYRLCFAKSRWIEVIFLNDDLPNFHIPFHRLHPQSVIASLKIHFPFTIPTLHT